MERYQCLVCGGALEQREGDLHVCLCCGRTFRDDRLERELSALSMLFSAEKQEQIANARQLMWEAAHTENVDSPNEPSSFFTESGAYTVPTTTRVLTPGTTVQAPVAGFWV